MLSRAKLMLGRGEMIWNGVIESRAFVKRHNRREFSSSFVRWCNKDVKEKSASCSFYLHFVYDDDNNDNFFIYPPSTLFIDAKHFSSLWSMARGEGEEKSFAARMKIIVKWHTVVQSTGKLWSISSNRNHLTLICPFSSLCSQVASIGKCFRQ